MSIDARTLALIKQRLEEAERNIQYVQQALSEESGEPVRSSLADQELSPSAGERIIEGVFDGQNMQGNDGQEYPVAPNYASKSKLVEGDVLKLIIGTDGSFVYKQIGPVERRRVVGTLVVDEHGNFGVKTSEKLFRVLLASVTFYKIDEGDQVTIILPKNSEASWGAVEHAIHAH